MRIEYAGSREDKAMETLVRIFRGWFLIRVAFCVLVAIIALVCVVFDLKIEKRGKDHVFVRNKDNKIPLWVSGAAFAGVAGLAFVALTLVNRQKKSDTQPAPETPSLPPRYQPALDESMARAFPAKRSSRARDESS
jgi:hypothetical protein